MPPERRVVLLVLGLAAGGQALRMWAGQPDVPPGGITLLGGVAGSPGAHRDSSAALARPLARGERVDLDRAPAVEIARLPRVGPRLARAIVAHREAHGPFGGLEALDRVPGIGPGLLRAIDGHVSFSAAGRPDGATLSGVGSAAPAFPGTLEGPSNGPPRFPGQPGAGSRNPIIVNLNTATVAELERLPFIGPSLARRIVAFRDRHGPFAAVDSLVRVAGIGPATLAKVREFLIAR